MTLATIRTQNSDTEAVGYIRLLSYKLGTSVSSTKFTSQHHAADFPSPASLPKMTIFDPLNDPLTDLSTTKTILVELKYAFYLKCASIRRTFPTLAFAAKVVVDSRVALLRSLDDICFKRIREATEYATYTYCPFSFVDYEVERYLVWEGMESARLSLSNLSDGDFRTQLEMMQMRGWRDRVVVHVGIEVEGFDVGLRDEEMGSSSESKCAGSTSS